MRSGIAITCQVVYMTLTDACGGVVISRLGIYTQNFFQFCVTLSRTMPLVSLVCVVILSSPGCAFEIKPTASPSQGPASLIFGRRIIFGGKDPKTKKKESNRRSKSISQKGERGPPSRVWERCQVISHSLGMARLSGKKSSVKGGVPTSI